MAEYFKHPFVRDFAEEVPNVGLHDMIHAFLLDRSAQLVQTPVLAALRPVAVAAVFEHRLVNRLQYPLHRHLDQLVFKTADRQRPPFLTPRLRYVAAPLRLRTVAHSP